MRIPQSLTSLVDEGIVDEVVRPLLSGKEAEVFLVHAGGRLQVAKVYKDSQHRTFRNRAAYTEGRQVRNSRDQRAIDKRSRHGRAQDEAAWRSTEVDMIYRLRDAGVRVPAPHNFIDGVLIMEMIEGPDGGPAPRLGEVGLDPEEAHHVWNRLLGDVVRMLCAGVVHGDLSEFNVLMAADGPVVIDFPQAVDAAKNQNARKLLLRDVANLDRFLSRYMPLHGPRAFGEEMWDLYAASALTPDTRLTGRFRGAQRRADTQAVLDLIGDADHDERRRRERQGPRGAPPVTMGGTPKPPAQRGAPPVTMGGTPKPPAQRGAPQNQRSAPTAQDGGQPHRSESLPRPAPPVTMGGTPKPPAQRPPPPAHDGRRPRVSEASPNHQGPRPAHAPAPAAPPADAGPGLPRRRVVIEMPANFRRPGPRRSP